MKRIATLLLVCLLCLPAFVNAQVNGDKTQRQRDFENYKQQREAAFNAFRDSINQQFAQKLEQRWADFQVFVGERRPAKPKPAEIPVAPKDTMTRESQSLPIKEVVPAPAVLPVFDSGMIESSHNQLGNQQNLQAYQKVTIDFYAKELDFQLPVLYRQLLLDGLSERAIAKFWSDLAGSDFATCVGECLHQREQMRLNDWAVFDIVTKISEQTFPKHYAEQTVFSIFVLNQLGLDAKIGRTNTQLLLLVPAQTQIYGRPYIVCDTTVYYMFSAYPREQQNLTSVSTYQVPFPTNTHPLDLNIYEPINFVSHPSNVIYQTTYWESVIPYQVNQNAIDFYGRYPQVDIAIYANAQMSQELKDWATKQMQPTLSEYSNYEAVSMLLYYLQSEFDYATDVEQFGYEKPFFCEENFYYRKNDCEDRAILFAYLVRNLVGNNMVLLDYPDHIATAVYFPNEKISGDYYVVNDKKYYVCDPTYVGASIGEAMPMYKDVKADIILLREN